MLMWGGHSCVYMVVGYSTTSAISTYHNKCYEFESWGALDTTFCDIVCLWLAVGLWFSLGTQDSSTSKTDCHATIYMFFVTEILLKVAFTTENQCKTQYNNFP
jgi:hypothetical protein